MPDTNLSNKQVEKPNADTLFYPIPIDNLVLEHSDKQVLVELTTKLNFEQILPLSITANDNITRYARKNIDTEAYLIQLGYSNEFSFQKSPTYFVYLHSKPVDTLNIWEIFIGIDSDPIKEQTAKTYFAYSLPTFLLRGDTIHQKMQKGNTYEQQKFFYQSRRSFIVDNKTVKNFKIQILDSLFWNTFPKKGKMLLGGEWFWRIEGLKNGYYHEIKSDSELPKPILLKIAQALLVLSKQSEIKTNRIWLQHLKTYIDKNSVN